MRIIQSQATKVRYAFAYLGARDRVVQKGIGQPHVFLLTRALWAEPTGSVYWENPHSQVGTDNLIHLCKSPERVSNWAPLFQMKISCVSFIVYIFIYTTLEQSNGFKKPKVHFAYKPTFMFLWLWSLFGSRFLFELMSSDSKMHRGKIDGFCCLLPFSRGNFTLRKNNKMGF